LQPRTLKIQKEEALIDRCRKGDELAYRELYLTYNKAMFNLSMRMLNNREEAEDLLQDCFVKAFGNIAQLKDDAAFGSWLKRMVVNRSIDLLRKRGPLHLPLDENLTAVEEPEEEQGITYEPAIITEALATLPDGYRLIVGLFLFENYSHKMIAEKLGISEGTSKSQYARGRAKLAATIRQLNNERQA
jgi:RNA polymerase sigma factor (sigma-70 family)